MGHDNLHSTLTDPADLDYKICLMLDACHMIKLARNVLILEKTYQREKTERNKTQVPHKSVNRMTHKKHVSHKLGKQVKNGNGGKVKLKTIGLHCQIWPKLHVYIFPGITFKYEPVYKESSGINSHLIL